MSGYSCCYYFIPSIPVHNQENATVPVATAVGIVHAAAITEARRHPW